MPKKTKAKGRLDKFYHLAKEQGYRSRAAFKLFQLNRKYNFLNGAQVVVDLCAAPGGWMQVCAQTMPSGSTIVGVDLVRIKTIPGCKAFQMDITTPQCVQLLKDQLPSEADVFLHDGAPNVGASWAKDAYNQNDLVLSSLKLASQFLKKGGSFITKVFRSTDYNSLIWVFNKFFGKVEATKPLASRFVSAEIFVVCQDYLAPEYIDEKLFDTKFVFQDTEADVQAHQMQKEITSIDKVVQKRTQRHRSGYADDVHQTVYQGISFEDFMKADNPYPIFLEYAKITMSEAEKEKYVSLTKTPKDFELLMEDIKVLGKREMVQLLKWRSKIKIALNKLKQHSKKPEVEGEVAEQEEIIEDVDEDIDEDVDENIEEKEDDQDIDKLVDKQQKILDQQSLNSQKLALKEQRKQREKTQNQGKKILGKGLGLKLDDDQDLIDFSKHREILNMGFVELNEDEEKKAKRVQLRFKSQEQLDQNLELLYENKKSRKEHGVEKAKQKKLAKIKEHLSDDEQQQFDEDEIACKPLKKVRKDLLKSTDLKSQFFDREIFQDLKKQINNTEQAEFQNPLKGSVVPKPAKEPKVKEKVKKEIPKKSNLFEDDSDSDKEKQPKELKKLQNQVQDDLDQIMLGAGKHNRRDRTPVALNQDPFPNEDQKVKQYELNLPLSDMEKRRKKLKKLAQKEERKLKYNQNQDPNTKEMEIVPEKKLEDYEIDDLATNLALAKKMMRKKTREQIINNSFGREKYDDQGELPKWFVEDEDKHQYKIAPITKEEFEAEKSRLYEINSRVPKKVMEAKIRKWKQTQKKLQKAAKKATQIFDTEGLNDKTKIQQVQKLYKKEKMKMKNEEERRYVVSKKGQSAGKNGKNSRNTVFVDKRLKKDKRAQKRIGVGQGKKRRQVSRRKGKKQKS